MAEASSIERFGWASTFLAMTLAWLIPNHYPPWTSFYNESASAIALVALTVSVWCSGRPGGVPRAAWFMVGVAAIPWLQYAAGLLQYSGDAFIASAFLM